MLITELYTLLESTGLPVEYLKFENEPQSPAPIPPFIVYYFENSENFGADNRVYEKINNYAIELYSDKKDIANESLIEKLFDDNDIFWDKTETYIDSEKMYEVRYTIQL